MKALAFYLVISAMALCMTVFMAYTIPYPQERVINCGVAEISPDFTPEMREACRRARMEKIK